MDYVPLTPATRRRLNELADLQPRVLAAMHGSTFVGDGGAALRSAADMLQRRLGEVPLVGSRHATCARSASNEVDHRRPPLPVLRRLLERVRESAARSTRRDGGRRSAGRPAARSR